MILESRENIVRIVNERNPCGKFRNRGPCPIAKQKRRFCNELVFCNDSEDPYC